MSTLTPRRTDPAADTIRVLHIDDDPLLLELTEEVLTERHDDFAVTTAESADAGMAAFDADAFDCVVCDYDLPGADGLEVLERVRAEAPEMPFVLFTGKGSEEIASEAISKGVSDYLQKGPGLDPYELLANRIENLTERARALSQVEFTRDWYERLLSDIPGYIFVVGADAQITYCSPSVEHVMGYTPEEVAARDAFEFAHPDDVERAMARFGEVLEQPDREITVEFRAKHADGSYRLLEVEGRNLLADSLIEGVIVTVRDVTEGGAVE